MYSGDF